LELDGVVTQFLKAKGKVGELALEIYKAFLKEGRKGVDRVIERKLREIVSEGAKVKGNKNKGV